MEYKLQDLIDIQHFQNLQDRLNEIYSFPSSIIDNDGNILTASGWQDICTQFHRKNRECEKDCIQSDQYILSHLHEADPAVSYQCPHGLVDNATPIIIDGVHYGNFFTGQFFLQAPDLEFFKRQAKKYGFNEGAYLEAVKKVPIWSQEQLDSYLFFIKGLIAIISESGLKNLNEIETRNKIEEGEDRLCLTTDNLPNSYVYQYTHSAEGKPQFLYVSSGVEKVHPGIKSEDVLKDATVLLDCIDPKQRPLYQEAVDISNRLMSDVSMDLRIRTTDDEYKWIHFKSRPRKDNKGRVVWDGAAMDITGRKHAEKTLRNSEIKMKSIFRAAPVGIGVVVDRVFQDVNERFCEIIGYSKEELIGKSSRFVYPDDEEYATVGKQKYKQIRDSGTGVVDTRFKRRDGEIINVLVSSTPLDLEDLSAGVTFTALDITERKKADEALINSERKWKDILVNTPQVGIALDSQAKIAFANDQFLKVTGWEHHEVIGQDWFDMFIPQHVRDEVRQIFRMVMESKDTVDFSVYENEIVTRKGDLRNVAWSNVLTKDAQGDIVDVTCLGIDITERRRAEVSLKESHERLLMILDSIDATVCVTDIQTYELLFMNKFMVDLLGKDMVGEQCYKVLRGESEKCRYCPNDRLIDSNGEPTGVYIWNDKNPITGRWNINHDRVIEWIDGRLVKLQMSTDITELKRMEENVRQAQKMESIGSLAGGIAHDFNNILAAIIGYTEIGLDAVEKGTVIEDCMQEIFMAGKRAGDLVKQILTFARQAEEERKPIQPGPIIKEVLSFIRSTIPTSIEIKQNIESESYFIGNVTQFHQVLMNLCTNAAHAMQDRVGTLGVSITDTTAEKIKGIEKSNVKEDNYVEIKVFDTGTGIPPDIIGSIFDPYFTTKGAGDGTGLGLAVVHGIVESYGGKITVESTIGEGTIFTIYFPVTARPISQNQNKPEQLPEGTERILFVDDEAPIAKMCRKILERLGYRVTVCTNSIEALELFRSKPNDFDLIFTDMTMPNMTGDVLAVEIMAIRPEIPVILCTGYSKNITDASAAEIGIKAFVYKPIASADLAKTLRNVLDEAKEKTQ